ncbi:SEC-C metal-binding domain-containing protein, partial [Escherichia coli]
KTQPATGETYPKSDLFNKADPCQCGSGKKFKKCCLH